MCRRYTGYEEIPSLAGLPRCHLDKMIISLSIVLVLILLSVPLLWYFLISCSQGYDFDHCPCRMYRDPDGCWITFNQTMNCLNGSGYWTCRNRTLCQTPQGYWANGWDLCIFTPSTTIRKEMMMCDGEIFFGVERCFTSNNTCCWINI